MFKINLTKFYNLKQVIFFKKYWKQISIILTLVFFVSFLFPGGEILKYSYKLNDVTREPIIAPFTFPILKTKENYELDKQVQKKSVPYIFKRNKEVVNNKILEIENFFIAANNLRSSIWRYKESKQLYYERKYHLTAEKAKNEFIADSASLEIFSKEFYSSYPFTFVI